MTQNEQVIDLSRKELELFTEFYNGHFGAHPTIIGGWAVDYYNSYYGSKDIDVVFETKREVYERNLQIYFDTHGYQPFQKDLPGLEVTYRKLVKMGGSGVYIDIDACSILDGNIFHQNHSKKLPYALVSKNSKEVKLAKSGALFRVPVIELLFLYKLKAYADRDFDSHRAQTQADVAYFVSKRDKDGSDLMALADLARCREKINASIAGKLAKEQGISDLLLKALDAVRGNPASAAAYRSLDQKEIDRNFAALKDAFTK